MATKTPLMPTVYTGTFIHTPTLGQIETQAADVESVVQVLENAAVAVDGDGVIVSIRRGLSEGEMGKESGILGHSIEGEEVVRAGGRGKWWFPGFVDTHIHASQHPNAGIFGRTTLLTWLNTYTFPLESSLSHLPTARRTYTRCVERTLSHGTTTAAYFATTHVSSTNLLADICLAKGQRAFIGRVCMDSDLSPSYYRDASPQQSIADTEATIAHVLSIDPTRATISPIITPRFAPSCSSTLLADLGHLAKKEQLPIQTHISENPSECTLVGTLFPNLPHYAGVYDHHGLLTPRTVLAHAVHLSAEEQHLVKSRGCGISHCPVSNTSLSSGLCPVRELLDQGITVGLGTDVSGGYSSSILVAAREAGMVSRIVAALHRDDAVEERGALAEGGRTAADVVGSALDAVGLSKKEEEEGGDVPAAGQAAAGEDDAVASDALSGADRKKLTVEECLYLATMGGSQCLGLADKIGSFAVGKQFDAQLVEVEVVPEGAEIEVAGGSSSDGATEKAGGRDGGLVEVWGEESWEERVAKWVVCGDDRNTKGVWVGGRRVHWRG